MKNRLCTGIICCQWFQCRLQTGQQFIAACYFQCIDYTCCLRLLCRFGLPHQFMLSYNDVIQLTVTFRVLAQFMFFSDSSLNSVLNFFRFGLVVWNRYLSSALVILMQRSHLVLLFINAVHIVVQVINLCSYKVYLLSSGVFKVLF